MSTHVRFGSDLKLSLSKLINGVRHPAAGAGYDLYTGILQHLESFGSAVPGDEGVDMVIGNCLAGLNAGSLG
jgi:hypothetical protein